MDLQSVADELYGLAREDFTTARTRHAKAARAAGDARLAAEIGALPKPTTSVWLLNILARDRPDALGSVLSLGSQMQRAQADGDGAELRTLAADQQPQLTAAATAAAEAAAARGVEVTKSVRTRVVQSLQAAMADPEAAGAVASGRLLRELASPGFGSVDLTGAVASPETVTAYEVSGRRAKPAAVVGAPDDPTTRTTRRATSTRKKPTRAALAKARATLAEADASADRGAAQLADATERQTNATAVARRLRTKEQRLRQALAEVTTELTQAKEEERSADRARSAAERTDSKARFEARRARAAVEELTEPD